MKWTEGLKKWTEGLKEWVQKVWKKLRRGKIPEEPPKVTEVKKEEVKVEPPEVKKEEVKVGPAPDKDVSLIQPKAEKMQKEVEAGRQKADERFKGLLPGEVEGIFYKAESIREHLKYGHVWCIYNLIQFGNNREFKTVKPLADFVDSTVSFNIGLWTRLIELATKTMEASGITSKL